MKSQKGGYICRNCHRVIHENISLVNKIYDEQNIIRTVLKDIENTIKYYKQSLICSTELIRDPLKLELKKYRPFMEYLIALFEISERKRILKIEQGGVTRKDMLDYLGYIKYGNIFEKRNVSEKYVEIVNRKISRGGKPTKYYYINDEGRKIVRLMYYFRDYYRNLSI